LEREQLAPLKIEVCLVRGPSGLPVVALGDHRLDVVLEQDPGRERHAQDVQARLEEITEQEVEFVLLQELYDACAQRRMEVFLHGERIWGREISRQIPIKARGELGGFLKGEGLDAGAAGPHLCDLCVCFFRAADAYPGDLMLACELFEELGGAD